MIEDRQGEERDVVGRKAKQKMIEYRQNGVKDVVGRKARRKVTEDQQKKDVEQIAGSNYIATDQFSQGREVQSDHEFRKAPNPNASPAAEGSGSGRGRGLTYDRRNGNGRYRS
ncbi:hypothetical protein BC938DRAFT_475739 [Jimgerdemannia flammicorona]|uniref:Uncharacterized protein n=1 Tax=Jimgerdemannia flammicorona TaxID=994334 RepID=A0A433QZA9_9FUNG|nr:hypothetical protein BC938DRAFT_475739 [Jimgerdemannia flammicorona]